MNEGTVLEPKNNVGAAFLLIQSLILLSFSIMVLIVFYKVPDSYKLVVKGRLLRNRIKHSSSRLYAGNNSEIVDTKGNDLDDNAGGAHKNMEQLLKDHIT